MAKFRKRKTSSKWHWQERCPGYPKRGNCEESDANPPPEHPCMICMIIQRWGNPYKWASAAVPFIIIIMILATFWLLYEFGLDPEYGAQQADLKDNEPWIDALCTQINSILDDLCVKQSADTLVISSRIDQIFSTVDSVRRHVDPGTVKTYSFWPDPLKRFWRSRKLDRWIIDRTIKPMLQTKNYLIRREILARPYIWNANYWQWPEWISLALLTGVTAILMRRKRSFYALDLDALPSDSKVKGVLGDSPWNQLLGRDFTAMAMDVHHGRESLDIRHYRGAIHWFRDATEKSLSFALILGFNFCLIKIMHYSIWYLSGQAWHLIFIPFDINIVLAIAGWSLIIDGLIQISAMVDAPGVSRTLDSMIVIVAGFVIMLVNAEPGEHHLVTFGFGKPPEQVVYLSVVISILFLVRTAVSYLGAKSRYLYPESDKPFRKIIYREK